MRWSPATYVFALGPFHALLDSMVPLCHSHHLEQHRIGIKTFAATYALDLKAIAAELWDGYQEGR